MHEFAMQLFDHLRTFEHDLRYICTGLQIAAPFQLEKITLGADHGSVLQALE
jgi:hypothetical protein